MDPEKFKKRLLKREKLGNKRQLSLQQNLIDFSSNDYLGLARSPLLAELVDKEIKNKNFLLNRLGSTGSRLLTGNSAYALNLENKIARFHGFENGTLYNCGYMANIGLLSAIANEDDCIFFDINVHASTYDGMRLSKANAFPFKHNDHRHLENRLKTCIAKGNRFICVESIYSTDGSKAPLKEICQLAKKHQAFVIVDEAHAVGIFGHQGKGVVFEENLCEEIFALVITFGKALGTYGAIVLGSELLKEVLINFSNSLIYTTALPLNALIAINCSYNLFPYLDEKRQHLLNLIQIFSNFFSTHSLSHIQPIYLKSNNQAKKLAHQMSHRGFDVRPLLSPTVQQGQEMIRICLHAFNTKNELRILLDRIHSLKEKYYD